MFFAPTDIDDVVSRRSKSKDGRMHSGENAIVTRDRIASEARTWVGTPFAHQGRLKGRAVDCVGLAICVAEDLGILDRDGVPILRTDHTDYGPEPASLLVHQMCIKRLIQKSPTAELMAGDVLTLRVPTVPCHVAIVTMRDVPYIVHAYSAGPERCVEHILNESWQRRIIGKFSFPGVVA